jgi:hypothetical protein
VWARGPRAGDRVIKAMEGNSLSDSLRPGGHVAGVRWRLPVAPDDAHKVGVMPPGPLGHTREMDVRGGNTCRGARGRLRSRRRRLIDSAGGARAPKQSASKVAQSRNFPGALDSAAPPPRPPVRVNGKIDAPRDYLRPVGFPYPPMRL